jgi:hypothetical protein
MCFFFLPKKADLTAGMFWIQVDFGLLSHFLAFFEVMDIFIKVFEVF